jgi:hypothetical protein
MKPCSIYVLSLMLAGWVQGRAAGAAKVYYSIAMNDNLVGYAVVEADLVPRAGEELLRLKSTTALKVGLLGKPHNVLLESETLVRPDSGRPVHYKLTSTTNDVIQHTECEVAEGKARTWSHRQGEKKGAPTETKLAESTLLLGGNNFAHWRLVAKATASTRGGKARIPVFLPEGGASETIELTRGETRDLEVRGKQRSCTLWREEKSGLSLWVDARSDEFVRMEVPAQQITITLADEGVVKQAQKARAEDVLARHFAQSDVIFDDYLKVTLLKAEIDVQLLGTGRDSDIAGLTTSMQTLEGKKDGARLTGTVTVRTQTYEGKESPRFPGKPDDRFARWLKPEPLIESDHPSIVTRSAELVKGAMTRWEATLRIARWVNKEIRYTIADTPSARLALEKRAGDCGPHSTLTVALLRASGIPARLVGGLMYAPTFGGSFGQHAWVEVHLGEAGWVPLDPTTGEEQKLGATHIKLFEGLGGVVPRSIRVVAFEPANQAVSAVRAKARPLPWKLDKQYAFKFSQDDKEIGREVITFTKGKREGKESCQVKSELNLKAGGVTIKSTASLTTAPNGLPLVFHRVLEADGKKYTIECTFREGTVQAKVSGDKELAREIKVPEGVYCFDNNLMASWALIFSQLNYEAGKEVSIRTFHPSSLQILPIAFKPGPPAQVTVGGKKVECYRCEVASIANTFWITRDGMFVRAQQGGLVIELTEWRE